MSGVVMGGAPSRLAGRCARQPAVACQSNAWVTSLPPNRRTRQRRSYARGEADFRGLKALAPVLGLTQMPLDSKLVQALKDADIQLAIFIACAVLLMVRYFGGLSALDTWTPWVWVGLIVSGCFLAVSCLAAFLKVRS
jgi:hypothetical protein